MKNTMIIDVSGTCAGKATASEPALGHLTKFLEEFRKADPDAEGCRTAEWLAFWGAVVEATRVATCTAIPVEGRWVLRSRLMREVPLAEREGLVRLYISSAMATAMRLYAATGDESHPGVLEELKRCSLAAAFCETVLSSPRLLIEATPKEWTALQHFPLTLSTPNTNDIHEPIR